MHIALVISSLEAGGAERVASELATYWAGQEHRITVITLSSPDISPFYTLGEKVELIQLDLLNEAGGVSRLINIGKRILTLRKALKRKKPDLILSFIDITNLSTLLAAKGLNIPVLVAEHTHPAHHKIPKLYVRLRHYLYAWAKQVVMLTKSAAAYFSHLENVTVIPNAVSRPDHFVERGKSKYRHLISVGRLIPSKGYDVLIKAVKDLYADYPDMRLTLYGEGPERGALEEIIKRCKLENIVCLPGITHDVNAALIKADFFVFPSLYEGFPNALCEAMAVGLPVIASNCSGNVDLVEHDVNGLLFEVGDITALTQDIKELMDNPEHASRLGQKALTIADRYERSQIYQKWDKLLKEAIT